MIYFPFSKFWSEGNIYEFIIHLHEAERAGVHFDLRIEIDSPKNFISSFAGRNILKLLLNKTQKILLIPQDLHSREWLNIRDIEIKRGYGKGKIKIVTKGRIKVLSSGNNSLKFFMKTTECKKEVLNIKQCEELKNNITPFSFVAFGKNILMVRGKNSN